MKLKMGRSSKVIWLISLGWNCALLLPYAFGDYWAMVWWMLAMPTSMALKGLWEDGNVIYVLTVSLINVVLFAWIMKGIWAFVIMTRASRRK